MPFNFIFSFDKYFKYLINFDNDIQDLNKNKIKLKFSLLFSYFEMLFIQRYFYINYKPFIKNP